MASMSQKSDGVQQDPPKSLSNTFQKIAWENSTAFSRLLITDGIDKTLSRGLGLKAHSFVVADVVILVGCFGTAKTAATLQLFSDSELQSKGKSCVQKIMNIVAPLNKAPGHYGSHDLVDFLSAPILELKTVPKQVNKKKPTPFSLQEARKQLACLKRPLSIIKDDGGCLLNSHTEGPKTAEQTRLIRTTLRDTVTSILGDPEVSEDAKASIMLGLTISLNDDREQERNKLPPLSVHVEVLAAWAERVVDDDFYPGQIESQIFSGFVALENGDTTVRQAQWDNATARIIVTQYDIDAKGLAIPNTERRFDVSELEDHVGVIPLHDGCNHYNQIGRPTTSGPLIPPPTVTESASNSEPAEGGPAAEIFVLPEAPELFDGIDDDDLEEQLRHAASLASLSSPHMHLKPSVEATFSPPEAVEHFDVGSIVKVLAVTTPGVRPWLAHSYTARVVTYGGNGQYVVSPINEVGKKRRVPVTRLESISFSGVDSLFRCGQVNSIAKKAMADTVRKLKASEKAKGTLQRRLAASEKSKRTELLHEKRKANSKYMLLQKKYFRLQVESKAAVEKAKSESKEEIKAVRGEERKVCRELLAMEINANKERLRAHHLEKEEWEESSRQFATERRRIQSSCSGKILSVRKKLSKELKEIASSNKAVKRQLEQTKEEAAAALAACKKKGKGDVAAAESRGKCALQALVLGLKKRKPTDESLQIKDLREEKSKLKHKSKVSMLKEKFKSAHWKRKCLDVRKEKRTALKNNAKKTRSIKNKKSTLKAFQAQLERDRSDFVALEEEKEKLEEELKEAEEIMAELKKKLGGRKFDFEVKKFEDKESDTFTPLWKMLGKTGEHFSQDMIELGMMLMSLDLSCEQAVGTLRAFLFKEYPEKKEGSDYRVPHPSNFSNWRRYLEPSCHFVAVCTFKAAIETHVTTDATTKGQVQSMVVITKGVHLDPATGEKFSVTFPLKFEILKNGKAATEAAVVQASLHSSLCGGVTASLLNTKTALSDNAAKATSRAIGDLKAAEVAEIKALFEQQVTEFPERLEAAKNEWVKLSPEQKECAHRMIVLTCTGHGVNLTIEDFWAKSEQTSLAENLARYRASLVITSFFQRYSWEHTAWKQNENAVKRGRVRPPAAVGEQSSPTGQTAVGVFVPYRFLSGPPNNAHLSLPEIKAVALSTPSEKLKRRQLAQLSKRADKRYDGEVAKFSAGWVPNKAPEPYLIPKGKHLDGKSDIPSVQGSIYAVAKLFASRGAFGENYLNEKRACMKYATENGLKLGELSSFKGSRQGINVTLPREIAVNNDIYIGYIDKLRADAQPNELVASVFRDQSDFFNLAALKARSFIGAVFLDPLVFFVHAEETNRLMIRTIMDCAEEAIHQFSLLDNIGSVAPPAVEFLSVLVLTALPELEVPYRRWWDAKKDALTRDYKLATEKFSWPYASAHLHAAAPFMLATHKRNLDDNFKGVEDLKFAPTTSDRAESAFSNFDFSYSRNKSEGATYANFGVAQSKVMHFVSPPGRKRHLAEKKFRSAPKEERAEKVAKKLREWDVTSFFSIPREKRWEIILDVQKNFHRLCVVEPKEKLEEQDAEKVRRYLEDKEDEARLCAHRAALYAEHDSIVALTSIDSLRALEARFVNDQPALHQALCDQIRVRVHVYGMKRAEVPGIGPSSISEIPRLLLAIRELVQKPLPPKKFPGVLPTRPSHPALSEQAASLDRAHRDEVQTATVDFMALLNQGKFNADPKNAAKRRARALAALPPDLPIQLPQVHALAAQPAVVLGGQVAVPAVAAAQNSNALGRKKRHKAGDASPGPAELSAPQLQALAPTPRPASPVPLTEPPTAPQAAPEPAVPPRRIPNADARIAGLAFTRIEHTYRVFEVNWHQAARAVVAWYYDVEDAALSQKSILHFKGALKRALELASSVEGADFEVDGAFYAPVSEIRGWILESPHAMHVRPRGGSE